MRTFVQKLRKSDDAISAVVGAILMIAVTVVIGATVYAVVNGFGDDSVDDTPNAVFKAQSVDTDGDGLTDRLKISYITGPEDVAAGDVAIAVREDDGTAATLVNTAPATWSPGDFVVYETTGTAAATYFVTVSILGSTVVDTTAMLDE